MASVSSTWRRKPQLSAWRTWLIQPWNPGIELGIADVGGVIGGELRPQPAVGATHLARFDEAVCRVDDEAEPRNAGDHGKHLRAGLVNDEAQGREPVGALLRPLAEYEGVAGGGARRGSIPCRTY